MLFDHGCLKGNVSLSLYLGRELLRNTGYANNFRAPFSFGLSRFSKFDTNPPKILRKNRFGMIKSPLSIRSSSICGVLLVEWFLHHVARQQGALELFTDTAIALFSLGFEQFFCSCLPPES